MATPGGECKLDPGGCAVPKRRRVPDGQRGGARRGSSWVLPAPAVPRRSARVLLHPWDLYQRLALGFVRLRLPRWLPRFLPWRQLASRLSKGRSSVRIRPAPNDHPRRVRVGEPDLPDRPEPVALSLLVHARGRQHDADRAGGRVAAALPAGWRLSLYRRLLGELGVDGVRSRDQPCAARRYDRRSAARTPAVPQLLRHRENRASAEYTDRQRRADLRAGRLHSAGAGDLRCR